MPKEQVRMGEFGSVALSQETAERVWDILVANAGLVGDDKGYDRLYFIRSACEGTSEFRFQGGLGFGGKFRTTTDPVPGTSEGVPRLFVNMYREDETKERLQMQYRTNLALNKLSQEVYGYNARWTERLEKDLEKNPEFNDDDTAP